MNDDDGPWLGNGAGGGPRFPLGVALWLALLLAVGAAIWFLDSLFPGQLSSRDDSDLRLVRLVAVLALVSSALIFTRRISLGEVARNLSIWIGLAALLIVGYSFRGDLAQVFYRVAGELVPSRAIALNDGEIVINASADGHFYIDGRADGQRLRFMVDTGASDVVLSPSDARRIGVDLRQLRFTQRFQTANGVVFGARHRLDTLSIGTFTFADMEVSINGADMATSLLGIAALERLSSYEVRDGKLYLRR